LTVADLGGDPLLDTLVAHYFADDPRTHYRPMRYDPDMLIAEIRQ